MSQGLVAAPTKLPSLTPKTSGGSFPGFLGGWRWETGRGWGREVRATYQGFLVFHQADNLHRFFIKILVNIIGQRGENGVKILLGNRVMYHEHGLSGKQEKRRAGPRAYMGLEDLAGQWFGGLKSHARETTTLDAGAEEHLLGNVLSLTAKRSLLPSSQETQMCGWPGIAA